MECILFIGIQASGKSSFYREHLFHTHVRINLDMLKTRHREQRLFETCLAIQQPCVVDNTNPQISDRARYLAAARAAGFRTIGYYFQSQIGPALERNAARPSSERIPDAGVRNTHARLELPRASEGFDALYYVRMAPHGGFSVEEWTLEV